MLNVPPDVVVKNNGKTSPSETGTATATYGCRGSLTVSYTDVKQTTACSQTVIVRTWKAVTPCGTVVTGDQRITIADKKAPVLSIPKDTTLECDAPFTPPLATATDACDPNPTLTYDDRVVTGRCPANKIVMRYALV